MQLYSYRVVKIGTKLAAIIEKARADSAKSEIIDKAPLFVYFDMRNIKVPTLHIRLGLGNELLYAIGDFIRNFVEIDSDEIKDARLTLRDVEGDLNVMKQSKQDYVSANEDDYNAGRKSVAAYDKISKTRRFVQLQEKCDMNGSLHASEAVELEIVKGRLAAHGAYAPGSTRCIQAETFAIDYTRTVKHLSENIKTATMIQRTAHVKKKASPH